MSVEDLLKIPRETGDKRIVDFNYTSTPDGEYVTFDCFTGATPDLISSAEQYHDWLFGFAEHYKQQTGEENPKLRFDDRLCQYDVSITGKIPIRFRVDTNKHLLQFFYNNQNLKEARKLVDSFIDIIWYGADKETQKTDNKENVEVK